MNTGTGRLVRTVGSITFYEGMHKQGLVIILELPNGTATTQEMDQAYAELKPDCQNSTTHVAAMKLCTCVQARKRSQSKIGVSGMPLLEDLDDFIGGEEGNEDDIDNDENVEGIFELMYKGSACNVTLGNYDLAHIVNGFPGDPIALRSFDRLFVRDTIVSWWVKVGFMVMSRNALNDPKV